MLELPVRRKNVLYILNGRVLVMSKEVADDQPINEVGNIGLLTAHRLNYLQYTEGHIIALASFQYGEETSFGMAFSNAANHFRKLSVACYRYPLTTEGVKEVGCKSGDKNHKFGLVLIGYRYDDFLKSFNISCISGA